MKVLTTRQLKSFLKKHSEWGVNVKKTQLSRTVTFSHYIDGLILIARIAVHSEILHHHPDIVFKYGSLRISLTTHECKGLTALDVRLATRIDNILEKK